MEKEWTVYILECGDGTLYTGITDDLARRLKLHEAGKGAKYTRGRGPLTLRYRETMPDKGSALKREYALKRLRKQEKWKIIQESAGNIREMLANLQKKVYTDSTQDAAHCAAREEGAREMKQERTLVVLAAGIGSRFAGGIKQLQIVGPSGEVIMDYSIHDAIEAGFNRVIFIIRHDIQELFDQTIGNRIRPVCERMGVEVLCAYQEKKDLPGGYVCPVDRAKPWGTGQALLSCKGMLHGGFAVINADDYYGKDAFRRAMDFLDSLDARSEGTYGLIGFRLGNTLSDNGGVTRGLCRTEDGWLTHIRETKQIHKVPGGAQAAIDGKIMDLDVETPVSMNMWCFTHDVLDKLEARFIEFLEDGLTAPKSEFLIPSEMGILLGRGAVRIRVLPTTSQWFGMTFAEDVPAVREAFRAMTEQGIYQTPLLA